jgi:hypothetical protein
MGSRSSDSDLNFDTRLAELERQLREVRRAMKAVARGRTVGWSSVRTSASAVVSPSRVHDRGDESSAVGAREPAEEAILPGEGSAEFRATVAGLPGERTAATARAPRIEKERFAHYFSGHLFRGPPVSEERRVQRNRAIVMVVVVLLVGYVLYVLLK